MKRSQSFLTPSGIVLTVLLLAGLGLALGISGGLAFSPGPVSAQSRPAQTPGGYLSHAGFEKECRLCHQPLKTPQAGLCLDCHQEVAREIEAQGGVHGQIEAVQNCAICHPEHRGRAFDLNREALARFDHSLARFSLVWHQVNYDAAPMACWNCHVDGETGFAFSSGACAGCHTGQDQAFMLRHVQDFGDRCLECHDGQDPLARFDHNQTAFPLAEKHVEARCVDCHTSARRAAQPGQPFQGVSRECGACHAEPALHRGVFDPDCSLCHSASGWRPAHLDGAPFDHEKDTVFSLGLHTVDYAGASLSCSGCHPSGVRTFEPEVCAACHTGQAAAFMTRHMATYGPACIECHDGIDRMQGFEHARLFPLEGRHAETGCQACHTGGKYKNTPNACAGCHAEPEIHAGYFGLQCESCHIAEAWTPAHLQIHSFPLEHGGQGQVSCATCHPDRYVEYTCYGCHAHQPEPLAQEHARREVPAAELPACVQCHPAGAK